MISIKDILERIDFLHFSGDDESIIERVVQITDQNKKPTDLTWCSEGNSEQIREVLLGTIIVAEGVDKKLLCSDVNYIVVANPRKAFMDVLKAFFVKEQTPTISASAKISKDANIAPNCTIGENVVIEDYVTIGEAVNIGHNTVILKGTEIYQNVTIGSNCTIGGIGFGYEKNENGDFDLIPHLGNVRILKGAEIGNNTCIDRAVLGSTMIHENVKIDNLVHIAHGVEIGRNSVVIANAMIAGSVKIGENTWVSPSASILNKKTVGDNSLIGMSSLVLKNVESNSVVAGVPAKLLKVK